MTISLITAWLTILFCALTALKFITQRLKKEKLNRFFRKIHIPSGIALLCFAVIHGILAGNSSTAKLTNFHPAAVLFTWNWGSICLILVIMLFFTWIFRKQMKRLWIHLHRVLTAALVVFLILHIVDVGIQLPARLMNNSVQTTQSSTSTQEDSDSSTSSDDEETDSDNAVTFSGATLKDGTYEGSADGYSGTVTVSTTVKNGKVTKINVVSNTDTPEFFSKAESILDTIIDQQSLEVDAVSGATYSSAGLLNAVYDALDDAVISGTLKINDIDLSSVEQHGDHGHF